MSPAKSTWVRLAPPVGGVVAGLVLLGWLLFPGSSHRSAGVVTGETVKKVLLDGAELTTMLDQPFEENPTAPSYGGLDQMDTAPSPGDCAGVVNVAPQSAYRSAPVQSYAREVWGDAQAGKANFHPLSSAVMFVDEAVIALPSAADAQALFATFAERWKRCDGQPANPEPMDADNPFRLPGSEMHIRDVETGDTLLTAGITLDKNPKAPDTRALGVRGNCLVEVLIAFTGTENATGSGHPETSGTDVARAMMDRVGKLG